MERKKVRFYPDYLPYVAAAAFVALEIVLVLALLFPPRAGQAIDFTSHFTPKPEWYFLWLYQLLRYFPGRWAFLGAVVLPLAFVALLIAVPYMDRGKNGRIKAAAAGLVIFGTFIALTLIPAFRP
jgi:quinol-cytochrome oxidoreductase complex cytochrome b subunit